MSAGNTPDRGWEAPAAVGIALWLLLHFLGPAGLILWGLALAAWFGYAKSKG